MRRLNRLFSVVLLVMLSGFAQVHAVTITTIALPETLYMSGSISESTISGINVGDIFDSSFSYDSDTSNAVILGGSLGTFYSYTDSWYGASGDVGSLWFDSSGSIDAFVADDLPSSSFGLIDPSLAGIVPDGNYDIFALNSYSSGLFDDADNPVGTGIDVFVMLVGYEGLFSGITPPAFPNDLLSSPELIGGMFFFDQYQDGVMTGYAYSLGEFSPVPVPAAVWLFGSGLMGLIAISRRRKQTLFIQ